MSDIVVKLIAYLDMECLDKVKYALDVEYEVRERYGSDFAKFDL